MPVIYLHDIFLIEKKLFKIKLKLKEKTNFVPSVIVLPTLNIPEVWNQLEKKQKGSVSTSQAFTVQFYVQLKINNFINK